jgi:hypothetical protein
VPRRRRVAVARGVAGRAHFDPSRRTCGPFFRGQDEQSGIFWNPFMARLSNDRQERFAQLIAISGSAASLPAFKTFDSHDREAKVISNWEGSPEALALLIGAFLTSS